MNTDLHGYSGGFLNGLLLVGHGTRSEVGTRQFLALASRVAEDFAPLPVEPAFLELQQPDIDAAVGRLIDRGISRLVTMPLLLFAAGHAKHDIPDAVSAGVARRGVGHIEQIQAAHLGCHPALVELSSRRMQEALPKSIATPSIETCLLLVGRGSQDETATAEMHEFAGLRQHEFNEAARREPRPPIRIEVAFLALARPLLADQLKSVACQGYRRVTVQPHFLFHGELVESIGRQVAVVAANHPQQAWIVTQPLADPLGVVTSATELIEKVVLDRCAEAGIHVVTTTGDG